MPKAVARKRKDRAKDLLTEMGKLRAQRDESGSVSLARIKDWRLARKVAASLLADAGLSISNERHVVMFLVLVASHLHLEFLPGKRSTLPVDNFTLLRMACKSYRVDRIYTFREICRSLCRSEAFSSTKLNTVRTQLGRLIERAIRDDLNVGKNQAKLNAMRPMLIKIQSTRKSNSAQLAS